MNGQAHAAGSGMAMAIVTWCDVGRNRQTELTNEERFATAVGAGSVGAFCGSLPDLLEPAIHPNHRQFFHSVAFGLMVAAGMGQLYRWAPDEPWQRVLRGTALIAGGAYLVHLLMDATTAKSLPLVGRL
jgi:hypothetical protein